MSDGKMDKAALIAQIKKRLAEGPSAGDASAAAGAPSDGDSGAQGGGEPDMAARIAALKAKMDAGKAEAAAPAAKAAPKAAPKAAAKPRKAGGAKNIFPVQPINKRIFGDDRLYKANTLNLWFIVGGLLLTVAVLLMWRRDHVRGWKPYQEEARLLTIQRFEADVAAAEAGADGELEEAVKAELAALEAQIEAQSSELDALTERELEEKGQYYAANQAFQIAKSEMDAMRYAFEETRLMHGDDAELLAESQEEFLKVQEGVREKLAAADAANAAALGTKNEIKAITAAHKNKGRELSALTEERDRLTASLAKIEHGVFNDYLRNAPVLDMLAPTVKIEKVVLDKLRDNYNFMHVGKVDMCITCHVNINNPAYANWDDANEKVWLSDENRVGQRVLNAHPNLDLFIADNSPHALGEFGCTVCHLGRGQAVEFERTFHTPTADSWETRHEKEERWVEEYNYDPAKHYWDWPMTPSDKLYSSCYMCHSDTERLNGVPEYNESRELVETLGCAGCHKIKGLEYLRKVGPDLTNLALKTPRGWSYKWAMSPKSFRPTTRMPHFWNQSNAGAPSAATIAPDVQWNNNSDAFVDDWGKRNQVEARAVVNYIYKLSEDSLASSGWSLNPVPDGEADVDAGRATLEQRGCLGCHSIADEGWLLNDHGPDLSAVGSKVDARWLYNWILDPKRYFPDTVMPDLRLSEQEAWDITAYLMTLTDPTWEAMAEPSTDQAIVDQIAVEQLSAVAGEAWAREQVAEMATTGDDAVELYVGEKLFSRYGCAGCHMVPEHYNDTPIGTELTYEALKELTKFDFGHEASHGNPEAIHHSLPEFFRYKMRDPRVYDRMPVVDEDADGERFVARYDQKVKLPGEKLKMPNFNLDDQEVELMVQFLLGLRDDGIDDSMKVRLDGDAALIEAGNRAITKYNCIGCHRVGQYERLVSMPGADNDERLEALAGLINRSEEYGLWTAEEVTSGDMTLFHEGSWLANEFYYTEWEETIGIIDEDAYDDDFLDAVDESGIVVPDHFVVLGEGEGAMGEYIEEPALRPPTLRKEGEKVDPEWFYNFLLDPFIVRTHVEVRMPTFGMSSDEALGLVRWFSAQSNEAWPFESEAHADLDQALYDKGSELFTVNQCNQCHPSGDVMPTQEDKTQWGPDLSLAAERLKAGWIHDWLVNPPEFQPGTRMPNFMGEFSDGEYAPMYDDYEERVDALVYYLKNFEQ